MVVCFPTVVFHRHLVVVVRAVWRCMVYDGGVVEGERVGCWMGAWLWNVSVADFWREKHDGMEVRWGNDGGMVRWWSSLVRNKRKTLTKISALFESHETL